MNKIVSLINWVNDTDPAVNDEHLNQIDNELDALDDRVIELETACVAQAENSEAWAVGERDSEPVESSDPTYNNNSKYYAGRAENSATSAGNSAASAAADAQTAYNARVAAVDASTNAVNAMNEINHTLGITDFQVNMATGELEYLTNIPYVFQVNSATGNLEWEVNV